jgi:hypothetical protein
MRMVFENFAGINNVQAKFNLSAGRIVDLAGATNCDVNDARKLQRRSGFTEIATGATHSLFSDEAICLYRQGTTLYRLLESWTSVSLKTGLTAGAEMTYASANDRVFMSDGVFAGWTRGSDVFAWGITPPTVQPAAAQATAGALPPGKYQYAVTFLRDDGEESATPRAGVIECSQGIAFSAIPVSSEAAVTQKAIYLSQPNGKTLRRALLIPNASTTASYTGNMLTGGDKTKLTTQFKMPPPPGRVLAQHGARMLVGWGCYLLFSDPYRHELFDWEQGYAFSAPIRILVPLKEGVLVGTDKECIWMAGADAADYQPVVKARYGAIAGSASYVDADALSSELSGEAAMFGTRRGICLITSGGAFRNLTTGRYEFTYRQRSAAVFRDLGKLNSYLLALR